MTFCTPILDPQGEVIGFFEVLDKLEGAPITDADVEFLMALSPIASIAIENAQAYQKISNAESAVQDSYAQSRALAARLQTIREEERTDIAREPPLTIWPDTASTTWPSSLSRRYSVS